MTKPDVLDPEIIIRAPARIGISRLRRGKFWRNVEMESAVRDPGRSLMPVLSSTRMPRVAALAKAGSRL